MGWKPEEGYHQKHVKYDNGDEFTYKLTDEQEKFNDLNPEQVPEGIKIARTQLAIDRGEKVAVEEKIPRTKDDEPIEYIIEDEETKENKETEQDKGEER